MKGLEGRHIVQIASGLQHSIVLDSEGYVLVFGCAGYCRLGLGDQRDALIPKLVPAFSNERAVSRAAAVFAGPTCSAVIDRGGMYWLAGKVSWLTMLAYMILTRLSFSSGRSLEMASHSVSNPGHHFNAPSRFRWTAVV